LRSLTQPLAPDTPITLGFTGRAFEPGDAEFGVDRETLTSLLDVTGCCVANTHIDPYYALGYPQQVLLYTLMRSFAPGKPLANLEDDLVNESPSEDLCTFKYVHSVLWEVAMAGLNASALRVPLDSLRPECIEAYATAGLDLNRLAPIVAAFQQAPVEVAILWSMPSKIYANGVQHLESARYAFEGCSFAGYKAGFITEKQCVENHLPDLKVLVVPDTPSVANDTFPILKEFMQGQGVVIRTSSSILFDEHGYSRRDIISNVRRTVLVHGQNLPAEYLHAMDAVATSGELPPIPRTVNQFGYPEEGVKSRYVEIDGQGYLYVINLRKDPITSYLHGGSRSGHDLIHGRDVSFPMRLTPLVPMLVRLDKQEAPAPAKKKSLFGKKHEGPGKPK
jgi:hypothetical protein